MTKEPKDLLLLVWVHGFKGNEVTFESFPDRVSHLLRSTHPSLRLESRVFPAYQTRGELHAATLAFVDWLTILVVELENDHGSGAGAGKAKIVLMGHSMGGLLIADAALDVAANTREADPMWPRIVALVAFDTPYLGLHPHTFKHSLTQAASYYEQARSIASTVTMLSPFAVGLGASVFGKKGQTEARPSNSRASTPPSAKGKETSTTTTESPSKSSWAIPAPSTKALYGFGAMALGAAAVGTAYYRREDFMNGWKFGYEHMTFVRNLWDEEGMRGRLVALDRLSRDRNVRFWNFYSHLPPSPPKELVSRTFAILPPTTHPLYPRFFPSSNTIATDEISAHMGMFNPRTDDGFYDLGLEVVRGLGERIEEEGVGRLGGEVDKGWEKGMMVGWREEKDEKGKMVWVEE